MKKILITDDSLFMRTSLERMLSDAGYLIYKAENGKDMLEKYDQESPDLVTLDITMPEMDGREALKRLKEKHPSAKVVMVSAMGQKDMVLDAIRDGACDFIVKPFEKSRVLDAIQKVLAMRL